MLCGGADAVLKIGPWLKTDGIKAGCSLVRIVSKFLISFFRILASSLIMKSSVISALALAAGALAAPSAKVDSSLEKRNPSGSFSLYAWGVAASGLKFFYSDGI